MVLYVCVCVCNLFVMCGVTTKSSLSHRNGEGFLQLGFHTLVCKTPGMEYNTTYHSEVHFRVMHTL